MKYQEIIDSLKTAKKAVVNLKEEAIRFNKNLENQKLDISQYEKEIKEINKSLSYFNAAQEQAQKKEYDALPEEKKQKLQQLKEQYKKAVAEIKGTNNVESC